MNPIYLTEEELKRIDWWFHVCNVEDQSDKEIDLPILEKLGVETSEYEF